MRRDVRGIESQIFLPRMLTWTHERLPFISGCHHVHAGNDIFIGSQPLIPSFLYIRGLSATIVCEAEASNFSGSS